MKFKTLNLLLSALFFIFSYSFAGQSIINEKQENEILREFFWKEFINLPSDKRPKIGVTLSAGGVRGFSHIGAMDVIEASGLPIDYMSGTSMGCIVGSMFTAGVSEDRLLELATNPSLSYISKDLSIIGVIKYVFGNKLFSSEQFQKFIDNEIGSVYYEELSIPFACASADIKTGEKVVFDSGPVALGVRASMNLPGIFAPVEYRQRYLVDGGVVDYIPIDLVKEMGADWVLAVFSLPDYSKSVPTTILGYILRTGDLRGALLTESAEKNANFLIESRVGDIPSFDPRESFKAVEIGAKSAYTALDGMKDNLLLYSVDYVLK